MMDKPDDIPQDVLEQAEVLVRGLPMLTTDRILAARAIMAERERCATVAEHFGTITADNGETTISRVANGRAKAIAAAIRIGGES